MNNNELFKMSMVYGMSSFVDYMKIIGNFAITDEIVVILYDRQNNNLNWGFDNLLEWISKNGGNIHVNNNHIFSDLKVNKNIAGLSWFACNVPSMITEIDEDILIKLYDHPAYIKNLAMTGNYDKIIEIRKLNIFTGKEFDCAVCYETYNATAIGIMTKCKHEFCKKCIIEWHYVKENNTCPLCRSNLNL